MKEKVEKINALVVDGYYKKPIAGVLLHNIFTNKTYCGVYKIMFGVKYYIGQTVHVIKRIKLHQREINKAFTSETKTGKFSTIIRHLSANSDITTAHVFMLEECKECDLLSTEQKWLTLSKGDANCLNTNFVSYANPSIRKANNFKPVTVKVELLLNTQRELNLYNTFLSDLDAIKNKPRVNLKKWFI